MLDGTLETSRFRSRFDLPGLDATRKADGPVEGFSVPVEPMTRVELKVEGAVPASNFTTVRVDGHLLLGTMLDEAAQKLTGYVRATLAKDVNVEVEFPDGTRSTFNVQHR